MPHLASLDAWTEIALQFTGEDSPPLEPPHRSLAIVLGVMSIGSLHARDIGPNTYTGLLGGLYRQGQSVRRMRSMTRLWIDAAYEATKLFNQVGHPLMNTDLAFMPFVLVS